MVTTRVECLWVRSRGKANKADLVGGHLGHHEMIHFSVLGEVRREVSGTAILEFQRADLSLFRSLVDRVP